MAGRRPLTPVPPGWFECPNIGEVCADFPLIPMKVPLGHNYKFPDINIYSKGHWSPEEALFTAHNLVVAARPGQTETIGMVLDLTNSDKYYDPAYFVQRNVRYCKVPCKGRGESPDPLAVNMAVWEIRKTLVEQPNLFILVHCTHGFNRSGFVIVSACMRLLAERGWCVERLLRRFSNQRPPGIYKDQYISDLFKRHNEHRPRVVRTPPVPAWKPEDDPDEGGQGPYANLPKPKVQAAAADRMTHCDKVGDPVCMEEARWVLNVVYDALAGQDAWMKGEEVVGFPHYRVQGTAPSKSVVGSQPVSLDRENLELLRMKRYWVTWKADGTRYMLLLLKFGAYLIDRAGEVRRVQMRFPSRRPSAERKPGTYPLGPPHDYTLLDGEMVVDDVDMETDEQRRRFLIYDVMLLGYEGVSDLRFADRFGLIGKEIIDPRQEEMLYMSKHRNEMFLYDWAWEPFSVRRKDFWPLDKARSLLDKFIPQLCHESDGLILQPYDDPYIPRTYPHLLKWKFPHMNSVDFKLDAKPNRAPVLMLNCGYRRKGGMLSDTNHQSLSACGLGDQRVEFPPDVDPLQLDTRIIECSFDMERKVWLFMRERTDKDTANHRSVFDKVMTSISDNITQEFLLDVFDEALKLDIYREDQLWKNGTHPTQLAQRERQLQQQQAPPKQPQLQQQQQAQAANGEYAQMQQHPQQQQQQQQQYHPQQQHMQEHAAGFGHEDPHLSAAAFSPAQQDYADGEEGDGFYEDDVMEGDEEQQEEEEAAYCVTDQ